jgi:hypothetical protein
LKSTLNNPVFVWASDIHINSKSALSLPVVDLGEGSKYYANKAQVALWEAWKDAWKQVKQKAGKRPVVICFGGEICDIDYKKRSEQFIVRDRDQAQEHAMDVLEPALAIGAAFIILRGTEAHVGDNGAVDESMAKRIHKYTKKVIKNEETGDFSFHHARLFIGGRKFDLAHHVSMGGTSKSERNAANNLSHDLLFDYAEKWNEPKPDFAVRGHVHRVSDSGLNFSIRSIIAPCWKFQDSYIHRIGHGGKKPEIGLVYIDIAKKEVEIIEYDYKRKAPQFV